MGTKTDYDQLERIWDTGDPPLPWGLIQRTHEPIDHERLWELISRVSRPGAVMYTFTSSNTTTPYKEEHKANEPKE